MFEKKRKKYPLPLFLILLPFIFLRPPEAQAIELAQVEEQEQIAEEPQAAREHMKFEGKPRIVDGDSLAFTTTEVRLLCLDAVELHQSCEKADGIPYPCGEKAKEALQKIIGEASVTCLNFGQDKYMRPLVVCRAQDRDLARAVVAAGWAIGTCRDTRILAKQARAEGRGIWQGKFLSPPTWRKKNPYTPQKKGN